MIWTNAVLDGTEAHRLGIVQRLVEEGALEESARQLAESIAAAPPLAVRGTKRLVEDAALGVGLDEALQKVAPLQAACIRSKDFLEAMAAFAEKRAPEYQGH
jgi:enoyl-CoA hydratase/carnithine racemase